MLWLNKNQSLRKVSLCKYLNVIEKQGFNIRKVLQCSQSACVCLTTNNTIVKALNPSLAKRQFENLHSANKYFSRQGVVVPHRLSVKRYDNFYIIENEYINPKLFVDKIPLFKADKVFFKLFRQLSKKSSKEFGPLTPKNFLISVFINRSYIEYWDMQFEPFLKKVSKNYAFVDVIQEYYRILRKEINTPNRFILVHSDISPKHIFVFKSKIGCIDLEEAMHLDASFMWALWYVRTIHKRSDKLNEEFFRKAFLQNLDLAWLNFHVYRELFIQYYYQGLLNRFFLDYFKFLKRLIFRKYKKPRRSRSNH